MKLFRVLGEHGELVFQERVSDTTPVIHMEWPAPLYAKITKLEVVEVERESLVKGG